MDILERFLKQENTRPKSTAVLSPNTTISYRQLGILVRRFAAHFSSREVTRVLIIASQGYEAYSAMLGTLMAGAFYCPVNIDLPTLRKVQIIELFEPHIVVCSSPEAVRIEQSTHYRVPHGYIDLQVVSNQEIDDPKSPHELAYVIFTSGSTGEPKGVMIHRGAVNRFIDWAISATKVCPDDVWAQFSNIGFDLSVMDIYASLGSGATLVPVNSTIDRLFPAQFIKRHGVTIWHSVPSVVDLMNHARQIESDSLQSLRLMSFCGEPLLPQHLEMLFAANSQMLVFNTYGPTEGTVFCTWLAMDLATYKKYCRNTVSIGNTIPGWNITLEGAEDKQAGEIVIYGDYIGLGYWKDREQTEKVYKSITINGRVERAYVTGDWVEIIDGQMYFKKRLDRQVKIHGFRIELDEIDFYVRGFGIENCISLYIEGRLYTFIEGELDDANTLTLLREFLRSRLPYYEAMSEFVFLSKFPRNQNDKIDRNALILKIKNRKSK